MGSVSSVGNGSGGKGSENVTDGLAGWDKLVVSSAVTAEGMLVAEDESTAMVSLAKRPVITGDGGWRRDGPRPGVIIGKGVPAPVLNGETGKT